MKRFKTIPATHLPFHTVASLGERLTWLINIRWIAVIAIMVCLPVGQDMLYFVLPFPQLMIIAVILLVLNILYFFIMRYYSFKNEYQELYFAEIQIISDLVLISFLIHYSGGIGNPFYFLYIVQVILSAILFPGIVLPYINAVVAALLLTFWTAVEYFGLIEKYSMREESVSLSIIVVSLASFYITNFAGIYIINNFMAGYRALKEVIDDKSRMLEKSIEDRNKAFRYAAHELKAPVIAVQSSLAVIKDLYAADFKPEVKDMVVKAENRAAQILNMIKEIILISQYNLGMEKPEYENVDFNLWMASQVKQHIPNALQKNISLTFRQHEYNFNTEIDITGFEKILTNLVNNAIRYTQNNGSVFVEIFYNSNTYGFSVTDNGIGIEQNDLKKIFDEFYRGKNAKEMERIGTGLGLNLVKEIVEMHNGEISVSSTLSKGTSFIVTFPLKKDNKRKKLTEDNLILTFE